MTKHIKKFILFNVFLSLLACAQIFFYIKNTISSGSIVSLAMIIQHLLSFEIYNESFTVGLIALFLNIPLIFYSWKYLGRNFAIKSIYGTFAISFIIMAISRVIDFVQLEIPILPMWMAAICGGILTGIGVSGLTFLNGSAGGNEILGRVISRSFTNITIGRGIALSGIAITLLSYFVFTPKHLVYSIVAISIAGATVDLSINLLNRKRK